MFSAVRNTIAVSEKVSEKTTNIQKKMTKILVTGGAGFIGSHTTVELQQKGYEVLIADSLFNSYIDVIDHIPEITG